MKGLCWWLTQIAAQMLMPDEREAVLGDLMEMRETAWQGLTGVLSLVMRRQLALWMNWRPWLAAFGLALPGPLLLMGLSLSVSHKLEGLSGANLPGCEGLMLIICQALLLTGWSWTGGFVMGALSRRTVWVSIVVSILPCLFCLARFRDSSLPRLCLLLFLLPAAWGLWRGLQGTGLRAGRALVIAVCLTSLMIPSGMSSRMNLWLLNWPAGFLLVTAWQSRHRSERASEISHHDQNRD